MMIIHRFFSELIFWIAWIIIPLLWEITPAIGGFLIVFRKHFGAKKLEELLFYPTVTVIIPVYNSQKTLAQCIDAIYDSVYPLDKIEVFLIDNGSTDKSFDIFVEYQQKYFKQSLWWLSAQQGKSKALNKALFNSTGDYIINIDSDGFLDKNALKNLIVKFERNHEIDCMTGVVLVDPDLIEDTDNWFLRIFRRCEIME
ncbi:MAG: glycosyltransferase, partial [Hyphomonadaceae bacterium]|nr:glycosyltransferase [Clostridia bacterium]